MSGNRIPGPIGTDPALNDESVAGKGIVPGGGWVDARPLGQEPDSIPMVARIIIKVTKDWDPPAPDITPWVEAPGSTLADVSAALQANDEWGQGGGRLRSVDGHIARQSGASGCRVDRLCEIFRGGEEGMGQNVREAHGT